MDTHTQHIFCCPKIIAAVRELIKQNRYVSRLRQPWALVPSAYIQYWWMLHSILVYAEVWFALDPYNLAIARKKARLKMQKMLKYYDPGASKNVYKIVTGDKSWIFAYNPDIKQQSTMWLFKDESNSRLSCRKCNISRT